MVRRQNFFRDDLDDHPVGLAQDRRDVKEAGRCVSDLRRLQDGLVRRQRLGHQNDRRGHHRHRHLRPLHLWIHEYVASCPNELLWLRLA